MSDVEPTIEELPERVIVGYRRVLTGRSCVFCASASTKIYTRGDLMPLHAHCDCSVAPVFVGGDPAFDLNREVLDNLKARGRKYWEQRGFVDDKGRPLDPTDLPDAKTSTNREVGEVFDNELVEVVDLDLEDVADASDDAANASQRLSDKVSARAVDDRIDELLQQNPMMNVDAMRPAIEGALKRDVDLSDLSDLDDDVAEVIVNRLDELDDQFPGVLDGVNLRGVAIEDVEWLPRTSTASGRLRFADHDLERREGRVGESVPGGNADYQNGMIRVSSSYVRPVDGAPSYLTPNPLAPSSTRQGFMVEFDGTKADYLISHEFGHFAFFRANRNYGGATRVTPEALGRRIDDAIAAEMKRTGVYDKDEVIRAALSEYATTDTDELMAEAFAQYVGAPEPSDLARALVAIMMEQP